MVFLDLVIFAQTQNIEKIIVPENYEWHFSIKCGQCNEKFDKQIFFRETDKCQVKVEGSIANFVAKCKNCNRSGNISIHKQSKKFVSALQNGKVKSVLATFDCRGLQLITYHFRDSLSAVALDSGQVFHNIDLSDLWTQYDQSESRNVQIQNVKCEIVRNKNL